MSARRPDARDLRRELGYIERRARAMLAFVARVRERGDMATVEELEDLPKLRAAYRAVRAALRPRGIR